MKRKNKHPRKESERFQAHPEIKELKEPLDTAKEVADLAWSIDFAKQTPERIRKEVEDVLITVKKSEQNEN